MTTTQQNRTEQLRDEARLALERAFAVRFVWTVRTPALLMTSRMRVVVLSAHERHGRYLFHLTPAHREFLQSEPTSLGARGAFVAFACGEPGAVFVVPYRVLLELLHSAKTPHTMMIRHVGERHVLSGPPRIELDRFRIPPGGR